MWWLLIFALTGGDLMPAEKILVTTPLIGSLATKTGPLAQTPGSFLQLDDVRQERLHEWRNRQGVTHTDDLDDTFQLRVADLPGGGLFALRGSGTNANAGWRYTRNVPATASRWATVGTACSQVTPSQWKRRAIATSTFQTYMSTLAVGNGFRLVAWKPGTAGIGQTEIQFSVTSDTDGTVISQGGIGATTGTNPKAVYDPASLLFVLFWIDGVNVNAAKWNAATGAFVSGPTTLKNNAMVGSYLDAIHYTTNNITVVYNQTGGNAHQLEVTPSTFALATDADLLVSATQALSLLMDPDNSGVRFVALNTAANDVRVLRTTTAGAVTTNDLVEAGLIGQTRITGVAYQAGASWMVVYKGLDTGFFAIRAAKKYTGVVGAPLTLAGAHPSSPYEIDSAAWREPGTDAMRYILGVHIGGDFVAVGDFQANYYEMALEYDNSGSTIGNRYTEPQARLIPLNAGPLLVAPNCPPQVCRTGTNNYALPLVRIIQPIRSAGNQQNLYAVDTWDQEILSATIYTGTHPNLGEGVSGSQAGYLPAGLLLNSARGQLVVGHGASALPFRPTCTLAAFVGGLTAGQAYQYVVTDNIHDDGGNIWRSDRSVASASISPTAGNTQVNVVVKLITLENALRRRTVKIWRTLGNGSVYQLVHQRTILCDVTNATFTFNDQVTDANLASSDFLPPGLPATITPAFNHVALFDGRMWGAERDFPTRLRFTRKIQGTISPEFPLEFFLDLEDEFGDITGIAALDDKLIVLKDTAIYYILLGGPNDDGSGSPYRAQLVTSEVGAQSGTPYLATGGHVWMFHSGVYRINKSLQIEFIGEAIDKWFNQPMIETPQRPRSFTYNDRRDEVRLITTDYRFVYDMVHGCWIRDTFTQDVDPIANYFTHTLPGIGDMFFRSNSQVWWDYDTESLGSSADANGDIEGVMRSPWMRAAKPEGYMLLYKTRSLWRREPAQVTASWPTTTTYFNDDDSLFASSTGAGSAGASKQTLEARTARMKLTSFSTQITFPAGDLRWRISQWSWLIALKKAMHWDAPARLGRPNGAPPVNLWAWFDLSAGVTQTLGVLQAVVDQTGNGRNITSSPGSEPGYIASSLINGRPSMQLDIFTTQRMENFVENIPAGARTVITVCRPSTAIGGTLLAFRRSVRDWACYLYEVGGAPPQFMWSDGVGNIQATTPVDYTGRTLIVEHSQDGANNLTVRINNVVIATTSSTTSNETGAAGFVVGNRQPGGVPYTQGFVGLIPEILIATRQFNTAERDQANAYLAGKYAVAL